MEQEHDIFSYLPKDKMMHFPIITIKKGTIFIHATKEEDPELYYILDGTVSVFAPAYNGRMFLVDTLGRDDFIGKFSQMRKRDFNCEVHATTDCEMMVLTAHKKELFEDKSFALYFYLKTTDRVYDMYRLSMLRLLFTYEELLAYWLLRLSNNQDIVESKPEDIMLQSNISTRHYFNIMKDLRKKEIIETQRGLIRILKRDELTVIAANVLEFMRN